MTDKPYTERLGGSYTVDPATGKTQRTAFTEPAEAAAPPQNETTPAETPAATKKGK